MHFEHTHDFAATVTQVASTMGDAEFQSTLALPDLSAPEVVADEDDGTNRRLTLRYRYVGQLDPVAQKIVGGRDLTWVQDLRLDVASGRGTLSFVAEGIGGRADGQASVVIVARGDGSCRRRIVGDFRIRIPIVGGTAERRIVPGLLRRLDVESDALARRLDQS